VLQVWERGKTGEFRRVYAGDGPAWSEVFSAWLVVSKDGMFLRLSDDEEGTRIWPTEAETAALALAEKETALAEKQAALAEKQAALAEKQAALATAETAREETERERAEKVAVLARLAEYEALLAKLRSGS
jgi:hypothetical protein